VISLSLLAILAAVALLRLGGHSEQASLLAAAQKMMSDIRYAQELAITQRQSTRVVIETEANRYRLTWGDGQSIPAIMGTGPFEVDFGVPPFSGVTLSSTDFAAPLTFDLLGSPGEGGQLLESPKVVAAFNQGKIRLWISPYTGNLQIERNF